MSTEPLRIGILGAARIAPLALTGPARTIGARVVAVASRGPSRGAAFAAEHGVERVADSYAALLADPEVEVVYNALPHGLHAPWNIRALEAGKHVLSEKPSAANAEQARAVRDVADRTGRVFMEAFHYPYHPLFHRVIELIRSGAIGEIRHIDNPLLNTDPGATDSRWQLNLAGGATMDLGCYSLSCLKLLGEQFLGGPPSITGADVVEHATDPAVDESLFVQAQFPSGATGSGGSDMAAAALCFTLVVTGSEGEIVVPAFPRPHADDRVIIRSVPTPGPRSRTRPEEFAAIATEQDGDVVEHLGTRSSYTYQLEAMTAAVRDTAPVPTDAGFAVEVMELIDSAYAAAGLPPRPALSVS